MRLGRGRVGDDLLDRRLVRPSAGPAASASPRPTCFQSAVSFSIFFAISAGSKSPTTTTMVLFGANAAAWNAFRSSRGQLLDHLLLADGRPAERVVAVDQRVEQRRASVLRLRLGVGDGGRGAGPAAARAASVGKRRVGSGTRTAAPRPRSVSGVSTLSDPPLAPTRQRAAGVLDQRGDLGRRCGWRCPRRAARPMRAATPALSAGSRSRTSATYASATTIGSRWFSSMMSVRPFGRTTRFASVSVNAVAPADLGASPRASSRRADASTRSLHARGLARRRRSFSSSGTDQTTTACFGSQVLRRDPLDVRRR